MAKIEEKKSRVVDWEGSVTIERIAEVKKEVQESLDQADILYIRLDKLAKIDVSAVQLLYAAHYEAEKQNKEFKITGTIPEALRERLTAGGFLRSVRDKSLFGLDRQEA